MVLTVSRINGYIKRMFDNDAVLRDIYVEGEVSNIKYHSSGHIYFTLKDEYSEIGAVMFSKYASQLKFVLQNGMNVTVCGSVSVYEKSGRYQLYAYNITKNGEGILFEKFEKLKKKLLDEGIFDESHKKPIPAHPKCVAVVTSATGAAVRDVIRIITRRNKSVKIAIVPALVQGNGAAADIAKKIRIADKWGKADIIIVGRGGGSMEDLWAFNEEETVRAIYEAKTPIISAVGHETDFTLSDFAADLRASTPSAAAELSVLEIADIGESIAETKRRMDKSVRERVKAISERFNSIKNSYGYGGFSARIKNIALSFKTINKRTDNAAFAKLSAAKYGYNMVLGRSSFSEFPEKVLLKKSEIFLLKSDIFKGMEHKLSSAKREYEYLIKNMEAVSPLSVMKRGYSIAESDKGKIIRSVNDVHCGENIRIRLADGVLKAKVTSEE